MVMMYSGIFSPDKGNHPIPSMYAEGTGQHSPSAGLSRAFSEIIRGNFDASLEYNTHGIRIFAFFITQLLMRAAGSIYLLFYPLTKTLVYMDAGISFLLFIICFYPFLAVWHFM